MTRLLLSAALLVSAVESVSAHFVYVVPAKEAKTVTVVFSEDLEPDENVPIDSIAGLKLSARVAGKDVAVEHKAGEASLTATLPADTTLVYGTVIYGLFGRGEKQSLLVYHPKAIIGGATGKDATVGKQAVAEIVPVVVGGKVKFQFLVGGKPTADAEGSVTLDGAGQKVTTDEDGFTPAFESAGRYAVYMKHTENKAGEQAGKKYEQVMHYATLVTDTPAKK